MDGDYTEDGSFDAPDATGGVDEHLWLAESGRLWDMGPATVDTDADGIDDSLSRTDSTGLTVFTDTDQDGRIDLITRVEADGDVSSSIYDPATGEWSATRPGRLR
ncbi:MAG TPA: hypothetical protein PK331_13980 [Gordonia sp. (in: high G+C Gram-positive bacteria)]|uniref:DUF6802 family protein n=2 Tax=unclassified Gordonia (in: high G+C Gram-positive bacteria) TaxID=2657482 RepID=UPI000FB9C3BF|nr:DUF6802 family protein [Gordonia sp. (in: high G+C Gram-positive bacteria)]RUP40264.1 MAG: hypothetical protein EKK60_04205 [Gordonia sp. (in: high G+C Gram-positive bacteria)]HNP58436.1 hypothetical protein [Gordonia sp. (in: high G+C Gram-positive bacteria)]HRC52014.1 hypothetical protein [Gordonia sp. (in: high G+C Gram-positive bacteria)]